MPKSRLDKNKDYHENQDDEEGDNSLENAGGGSQPNLKMAKGAKGQRGQKTTGKGGSSDLEGTGDQA